MCNSQFSLFGGLTMETIKKEQLLKIKKTEFVFNSYKYTHTHTPNYIVSHFYTLYTRTQYNI